MSDAVPAARTTRAAEPAPSGPAPEAVALVAALTRRGWTMAVAESLTGGMVAAGVVDVPGASRVLRGGVVAYAIDLKTSLLGVDAGLLDRSGAVHPDVAVQMAQGVRARLGADLGLATTGVAGPGSQDGHPPGEVYVAVASDGGVRVEPLRMAGDRASIRSQACRAVLECALAVVEGAGG